VIRPIIQAPDDRLRAVAAPLPTDWYGGLSLPDEVCDLRDTFAATQNCIGLAAPQIGHAVRAIIFDVSRSRGDTVIMINPVIVKAHKLLQRVNDGCMSVKFGWERGFTYRPKQITVEYVDEECTPRRRKFHGLHAAVVHHEIDHLDGKLFTDILKPGVRLIRGAHPVSRGTSVG
jgi:peptide deformylase